MAVQQIFVFKGATGAGLIPNIAVAGGLVIDQLWDLTNGTSIGVGVGNPFSADTLDVGIYQISASDLSANTYLAVVTG